MRHVFILNPAAGKDHLALMIRGKIDAYFSRHPEMEHVIRLTDGVGAATAIARSECEAGVPVRLYACGGDGTLQETANGIPIGSHAELTVIPCGSGNDYVRIFGGRESFMDLPNLIEGEAVWVDAVDCGSRVSLNIASMGMDASVASKMQKYKNLPGVNGSAAYQMAIADVLCHPLGMDLDIDIESEKDGLIHRKGKYLLALAANGQYYGGGFRGAPQAVENDGMLDFVLIKKILRMAIPTFIGKYKRGEYEGLDFCEHIRGTAMRIQSSKLVDCNIDGECFSSKHVEFKLIPNAFRFVLPASVAAARREMSGVCAAAAL